MSKIDTVNYVLSQTDKDIIEYLYNEITVIRKREMDKSEIDSFDRIDNVYQILRALNRRNNSSEL